MNKSTMTKKEMQVNVLKEFEIDPYYIYVTLHLLECQGYGASYACDEKWDMATRWYEGFLTSKFNVETKSEYDCIVDFIEHNRS